VKRGWWLGLIVLALSGCGTNSLKRDIDVQGSLPRAIGLGAFASTCIIICIVTANFDQGDLALPKDDGAGGEVKLHESTDMKLKRRKKP